MASSPAWALSYLQLAAIKMGDTKTFEEAANKISSLVSTLKDKSDFASLLDFTLGQLFSKEAAKQTCRLARKSSLPGKQTDVQQQTDSTVKFAFKM